ncbi:MAG: VOC family protein [Pseudomonadota bacterium]
MGHNIIPILPYQDCPKAIDWLETAFGFERQMVVPGATDAEVAHAQLKFGNALIMVHSLKNANDPEKKLSTPSEAGGVVTTTTYVVVPGDEIEAHFETAKAAGAEITQTLEAQEYGGHVYVAQDPDGHIWAFGSYDPFAPPPDNES